MATASKAVIVSGGTNSKTKRVTITTGGSSITLPAKVQSASFRNDGSNDIRIRINASGGNYWTIKPGETTPRIAVNSATLDAQAVGASSQLECLFEG